MTERQRNIRAADILDRSYNGSGYNSRRAASQNQSDDDWSNSDDDWSNTDAYRGSHRAENRHQADDRDADRQHDSQVGRHHADHDDDATR